MTDFLADRLAVVDQYLTPRLWTYSCGCVCVKVYARRTSVDDITILCARKVEAGRNLAKGMLSRMWAELDYRLDVIWVIRGFHDENFLI
jgi:hypothetical protein